MSNSKKNIYVVCTSLNLGGAEMQSIWLANSLSLKNYKVTIVVLKNSNELTKYINSNVEIVKYKMYANNEKSFHILRKVFNFYKAIRLFRKLIKNEKSHVISFLFHANIFGFLTTLFTNSHHYICVRNDRFSSRKKTDNIFYRTFLVKIASNFAKAIVFNSNKSKKILNPYLSKKPKKIVIYNSVLNFDQRKDKTIIKNLLNFLESSNLTFVSVGRLESIKNYEVALDAFFRLKNKGIKFKYVIFGSGYLEQKLKNKINEYQLNEEILLYGKVQNAINYLHLFRFYLLASIHEGFPNGLIEAMNAGLVPLATNAGDAHFIIDSNRGIKLNSFKEDDIFKGLYEVSKNNSDFLVDEIIKNNKLFIKNNLDETSLLKKWIEVIEN